MADLFGFEPAIVWNEAGLKGTTRDGRVVSIEVSFFGRWLATIPLHGRDVVTRRSCATVEEARAAAEIAVRV